MLVREREGERERERERDREKISYSWILADRGGGGATYQEF